MHKTLFDAPKLRIVQTTLLMLWFDIYLMPQIKKVTQSFYVIQSKEIGKKLQCKSNFLVILNLVGSEDICSVSPFYLSS